MNILQIIPAEGWYVEYYNYNKEPGIPYLMRPLICWALISYDGIGLDRGVRTRIGGFDTEDMYKSCE